LIKDPKFNFETGSGQMTETATEKKYQRLKRATILSGLCAVVIFVFDSFMFGAPAISMFVLIYLVVYLVPVTLISFKNKPKQRFYGSKLIIYAILVMSSFGFHSYDLSLARSRAETVIAAVDQYHKDKGEYPQTLQNLVPVYLAEIPKPRIAPGRFYYLGGLKEPHLMYEEFPPFGRVSWSFAEREWITID
jgi:hypothetical protein